MNVDALFSLSSSQEERRVWEAPQVITVVPVDRTEGGPGVWFFESTTYHVAS